MLENDLRGLLSCSSWLSDEAEGFPTKAPRDFAGMYHLLDAWLNGASEARTSYTYCRRQASKLGQVLSPLDYQCAQVFGDRVIAVRCNLMQ
jgi:hypothetical protein